MGGLDSGSHKGRFLCGLVGRFSRVQFHGGQAGRVHARDFARIARVVEAAQDNAAVDQGVGAQVATSDSELVLARVYDAECAGLNGVVVDLYTLWPMCKHACEFNPIEQGGLAVDVGMYIRSISLDPGQRTDTLSVPHARTI